MTRLTPAERHSAETILRFTERDDHAATVARAALRLDDTSEQRRVQVWDGEGDCTLDVVVVNAAEADWLKDYLEGLGAGDVYVDEVPAGRLTQAVGEVLRPSAPLAIVEVGQELRNGESLVISSTVAIP